MIQVLQSMSGLYLAVVVIAALIIGFSKTSFGGLGAVAVALAALVMPARESTAMVLLLLLVGDVVAVITYRYEVNWKALTRLLPSVVPGLLLGALFIHLVNDTLMRRALAVLMLVLLGLKLLLDRRRADPPSHWGWSVGAGVAAGFTTMAANAAAPVMTLYFLLQRFDKQRFISTNAWFFFAVNLCKVPLTASLGLFTARVLWQGLIFCPLVFVGTWVGRRVIRRVNQHQFELVLTWVTVLACGLLLVR